MVSAAPVPSALERFSGAARAWFRDTFPGPTHAQELGWDAIAEGEHTLLLAPTGSGKTLAAFLWCLDRLANRPPLPLNKAGKPVRAGVSLVYISPLKALSYDIERNLRAPLAGLRIAAAREGLPPPDITVATRTGDTPAREREDTRKDPPDILITTPESLYLMLTSRARSILETVDTVIVDEIHTMAATKRGAHLALSLERLERLTGKPFQRIGLSATQRPLEEVAKYLGGDRPVRIADAGARRDLDLKVVVPVEDMTRLGEISGPIPESEVGPEARTSIWPALYPQLLDLVKSHRSSLIFVNNRRLAERIAARVNELAGEELLFAHHGSVSREQRLEAEERLKSGSIPGLVCTSSMELGVDMGAVDLVIQVESPKSVARGLQRVGRAGHQVGATSTGRIFPKFRGDLLECAVVTERMREGLIEKTEVPKNPLDVLAQQIVAACAAEDMTVDELLAMVRRCYNFEDLSQEQLEGVLGMLSGQYPSDEFADLKPRILWDRETNVLSSRRDARTIALVNAGTIPDRGLFGVFLGVGGPRVGELDEEMVYESRSGETVLLGATTWRIEQITRDQVIVSPAPGEPGKLPFWRGDGVGRPLEFGRAIGAFTREIDAMEPVNAFERLTERHDLDSNAANNLLNYLADEKEATGSLPTDRTLVVERFRDELGDWRMVILSPFGGQVHAPWAQALESILQERSGFDVQTIWSDDGIAVRFAGGEEPPPVAALFPTSEEVEELVVSRLGSTAMFATHFRENAGRALLLPKRRAGARSPLWLQRMRSANLLAVASRYGSFPIVLETYRECLRDVFDLPGLVSLLRQVESREIGIVEAETREASPFARSLLFDYIAAYMYEGDTPLAERRAQALTLDRNLLRDLLGEAELRELLDPAALELVELELQLLADNRKAKTLDQTHDLLRRLGDLDPVEVAARLVTPAEAEAWLTELEATRRACRVRIGGAERWIAIEDSGRYRDALGVAIPVGVPEAFLRRTEGALEGLLIRYARTHGPFVTVAPARRWAVPESLVRETLEELDAAGALLHGDFRPGGTEREWCDPEVLRQIKKRSLARLRKEVEPVDGAAYARFLQKWHGIGSRQRGLDRLRDVVGQIEGTPIAAGILEREVLAARVADFQPSMVDTLMASGELAWFGSGRLGKDDGRIVLVRREMLETFAPPMAEPPSALAAKLLDALTARGAQFFTDLVVATAAPHGEVLEALWDLVWAGAVTNDTLAPVRALAWGRRTSSAPSPRGRVGRLPPESGGRWSLVRQGPADETRSALTARAHARAQSFLERLGIVTREGVAAEDVAGGFSSVYPVLKAMEDAGRVRRGYFVEALGAAQFALPGAAERLRAERDVPDEPLAVVLAATDPAQPYGATLPWPRDEAEARKSYQRVPGARVVLVDGRPALYLERSRRGLLTFPVDEDERERSWLVAARALASDAASLGAKGLSIERIDGTPADESALATPLLELGFARGFRGLTMRPPRAEAIAHA